MAAVENSRSLTGELDLECLDSFGRVPRDSERRLPHGYSVSRFVVLRLVVPALPLSRIGQGCRWRRWWCWIGDTSGAADEGGRDLCPHGKSRDLPEVIDESRQVLVLFDLSISHLRSLSESHVRRVVCLKGWVRLAGLRLGGRGNAWMGAGGSIVMLRQILSRQPMPSGSISRGWF